MSYIFGTPYRDPDIAAVVAFNRSMPSALNGLKFKRISVRCPHCTNLGRKNPSMSSRLIPICGALVGNGGGPR